MVKIDNKPRFTVACDACESVYVGVETQNGTVVRRNEKGCICGGTSFSIAPDVDTTGPYDDREVLEEE